MENEKSTIYIENEYESIIDDCEWKISITKELIVAFMMVQTKTRGVVPIPVRFTPRSQTSDEPSENPLNFAKGIKILQIIPAPAFPTYVVTFYVERIERSVGYDHLQIMAGYEFPSDKIDWLDEACKWIKNYRAIRRENKDYEPFSEWDYSNDLVGFPCESWPGETKTNKKYSREKQLDKLYKLIKGLQEESKDEPVDRNAIIERASFSLLQLNENEVGDLIEELKKEAMIVEKKNGKFFVVKDSK